MPDHHLLTTRGEVGVRAPVAGEVLVGNAVGVWEPQTLGMASGSFGTPATLTTALPTLTVVAPGTPDYAVQDVTAVAPVGFADADEARSVLSVIQNIQIRLSEIESKLTTLGMTI